jgi:uncharacterized protein YbjT (DUF2867 family)
MIHTMRVLVTGATGRVGRAVVGSLTAAGVPVRALTRRPEAAALPANGRRARIDDHPAGDVRIEHAVLVGARNSR